MQKNHKDLLMIIKATLTDKTECVEGEINSEELLKISKAHQIIPLVFQGLYKVLGEFQGKQEYYNYTLLLMSRNQQQIYWLDKIQNIFQTHKIDYMPLKGASVRKLYPSSEMRLMGDLDILIREEQYPTIRELFSSEGLIEYEETDHELIWKSKNGVMIELHKKLIPSYNDDYYAYYCEPWKKARLVDNNRYAMSVEDEYIFIFTHMTKHYRDGGIGLRQMIDIWFFKLCHPEINMQYIESELEKLELNNFHRNILATIGVWFEGEKNTELTDYITERIIESGSYGLKEKCDEANAARLSARAQDVESAKRNNMIKLVFMPYALMKKKYPLLQKASFLLPIMWIVRWVEALIYKRDNISRQAERTKMINEDTVDAYTKELDMVGLKFNLKKE